MKSAIAFALVLLMVASAVPQQRPETTSANSITRDEAASLLRAYLKSKGYDTTAAPLDIEDCAADGPEANFLLFAVYVNTPQRLVTIGHYGVNRRTGDIWELVQCKRITSSAIARKQKGIREASGLSSEDIARLRSTKPTSDCF